MLSFCHVAEFTSFVAKKLYQAEIDEVSKNLEEIQSEIAIVVF